MPELLNNISADSLNNFAEKIFNQEVSEGDVDNLFKSLFYKMYLNNRISCSSAYIDRSAIEKVCSETETFSLIYKNADKETRDAFISGQLVILSKMLKMYSQIQPIDAIYSFMSDYSGNSNFIKYLRLIGDNPGCTVEELNDKADEASIRISEDEFESMTTRKLYVKADDQIYLTDLGLFVLACVAKGDA